jgi:hypothetical protein
VGHMTGKACFAIMMGGDVNAILGMKNPRLVDRARPGLESDLARSVFIE